MGGRASPAVSTESPGAQAAAAKTAHPIHALHPDLPRKLNSTGASGPTGRVTLRRGPRASEESAPAPPAPPPGRSRTPALWPQFVSQGGWDTEGCTLTSALVLATTMPLRGIPFKTRNPDSRRAGSSLDVAESRAHPTDTDRRKTHTGTEVLSP